MKSSLLSLLVSFSMVAFLTACGSDSSDGSVSAPSTPNEGSPSSFVNLTVEEVHSARVNDAVSDTNTSYYMFTTIATGDHNISATSLSGSADLNFKLYSDSALTTPEANTTNPSNSGEEMIVSLTKGTTYYLLVTNVLGSAVTFDLLIDGPDSTVFTSTVSAAIPDDNPVEGSSSDPLLSELNVENATTSITKVTVNVNITHTYDDDLDIYLISPSGTRVELSTFNGGLGEDYIDTVFDDSAIELITNGTAPFTGSFSPETPLSDVNGEDANGVWTLEITDTYSLFDLGTLNSWSMTIN